MKGDQEPATQLGNLPYWQVNAFMGTLGLSGSHLFEIGAGLPFESP